MTETNLIATIPSEDQFVIANANKSVTQIQLRDVYKTLIEMKASSLDPSMLWIIVLINMSFDDFCWIRFLCLNENEFANLIAVGPPTGIRQVHSTLSKRKLMYAASIGDVFGDPNTTMETIMIPMMEPLQVEKLRMIYDWMRSRLRQTVALMVNTSVSTLPNQNQKMNLLRSKTVLVTNVKASSWNPGLL
jgi:hypothetical protein